MLLAVCGPVRWLIEAAVAHDPALVRRVLRVARPRERRNRAGAYASYREGRGRRSEAAGKKCPRVLGTASWLGKAR